MFVGTRTRTSPYARLSVGVPILAVPLLDIPLVCVSFIRAHLIGVSLTGVRVVGPERGGINVNNKYCTYSSLQYTTRIGQLEYQQKRILEQNITHADKLPPPDVSTMLPACPRAPKCM